MKRLRLRVITNSAACMHRKCPRAYHFRHIRKIVRKKPKSVFQFGTSTHGWLERWLLKSDDLSIETTTDEYQDARVKALTDCYAMRWSKWRDSVRVIATEKQFHVPIINPDTGNASEHSEAHGKFDAVIDDGSVKIGEHKTTSENVEPGSAYIEQLRINSQVSTYLQAGELLGFDGGNLLYDILKKPGIEPKMATPVEKRRYTKKEGKLDARQRETDELPEEFYQRCVATIAEDIAGHFQHFEVTRLEDEILESARDLWNTAEEIERCYDSGIWPRRTTSCYSNHSFCDYWQICSGTCSWDDAVWYEIREPHSELAP
jgi:hypothetical protein